MKLLSVQERNIEIDTTKDIILYLYGLPRTPPRSHRLNKQSGRLAAYQKLMEAVHKYGAYLLDCRRADYDPNNQLQVAHFFQKAVHVYKGLPLPKLRPIAK